MQKGKLILKVYIAFSYKTGKKITQELKSKLNNIDYVDAFFPDTISIDADTINEMKYISNICTEQIKDCDVLVAIYPFGMSVSVEIGRFLEQQINFEDKKLIILDTTHIESASYIKLRSEAMIMPHVYKVVSTIEELIGELKNISIK